MNEYVSYLRKNYGKFARFIDYLVDTISADRFRTEDHKEDFRRVVWVYRDYIYDLHLMHPTYTSTIGHFSHQLELNNKLFTYCDRWNTMGDDIPSSENDKWLKCLEDGLGNFFSNDLSNLIPQHEEVYYRAQAMDKDPNGMKHLSDRYNSLKSQENGLRSYYTNSTGLG